MARMLISASLRLCSSERHSGAGGARHQSVLVVVDVALDEAHRVAALHDPPRGYEPSRPHGLEEIDLELEGGEGLALVKGGGIGHAHGGIGEVAENSAVERAHGIGMLRPRFHLHDGMTGLARPAVE